VNCLALLRVSAIVVNSMMVHHRAAMWHAGHVYRVRLNTLGPTLDCGADTGPPRGSQSYAKHVANVPCDSLKMDMVGVHRRATGPDSYEMATQSRCAPR